MSSGAPWQVKWVKEGVPLSQEAEERGGRKALFTHTSVGPLVLCRKS